ncbi:hypothetical protein Hanom_Chr05g00441301 [Helianthus anomalus]
MQCCLYLLLYKLFRCLLKTMCCFNGIHWWFSILIKADCYSFSKFVSLSKL